MPSNKSSSPKAAAGQRTPPPPTTASPALTQSPFVSDFYKHRRASTTIHTTPPPTTTTPAPTPDPYAFEKSTYADMPITDDQLELLKEQIRMLHGLPLTRPKRVPRIATLRPPKVRPRATLTSWRRAQLQQRRIVVRCGGLLRRKFDEYERTMAGSEDADLVYRRLRDDAMTQTTEQLDSLLEQQELHDLKELAEQAKLHEALEYRDNQGSRLRFKSVRGEPIISSGFRDAYDDYARPPFVVAGRVRQHKVYHLPKIDKRKEIWLAPFDDDDGPPLHAQPKTPPPKDKRRQRGARSAAAKRGAQRDRRSSKESARSAPKKSKASPKDAEKGEKKGVKRKRPPWHAARACPANVGFLW